MKWLRVSLATAIVCSTFGAGCSSSNVASGSDAGGSDAEGRADVGVSHPVEGGKIQGADAGADTLNGNPGTDSGAGCGAMGEPCCSATSCSGTLTCQSGTCQSATSCAGGSCTPPSTLAVGIDFACAVVLGGTVECWGDNFYGQLGIGSTSGPDMCDSDPCSTTPVPVSGLTGVTAVSVGNVACAVLSGGTVQCWGENNVGTLGNGSTTDSSTPVPVTGLTGATMLSVGDGTACAVLSGGTVECWGLDDTDELGNGAATGSDSCGGQSCAMTPVAVTGLTGATAVSVGERSACALLSGGTVECWGDNEFGLLGTGTTTGPDCAGSCAPASVAVTGLTDAIAVSVGPLSACALLSGGTIECWGTGANGELGNGSTTDSSVPVAVTGVTGATAVSVGNGASCAVLSGGAVECWGNNSYGTLGNGSTSNSATPVAVTGLTTATAVSVGWGSACAMLPGGSLECWGDDYVGELGDGSSTGPDTCGGVACATTPVAVQ